MDPNEKGVLKIHDCSELTAEADTRLDEDCLQRLESALGFPVWRGSGGFGFVLELNTVLGQPPRPQKVVVKVTERDDQELRVACALNALLDETPIFPHTFGWLLCNRIPERWRQMVRQKDRSHVMAEQTPHRVLFMFMQPVEANWDDTTLLYRHGYRVTLFLLLHGLWVAHERLGFVHSDLHGGNIMLQPHAGTTRVRFGQYEAEVTADFVPRLIDYGLSHTTAHPGLIRNDDVGYLLNAFEKHMESLEDDDDESYEEWRAYHEFMRYADSLVDLDTAGDVLPLLEHPYFDVPEIQKRRIKRRALGEPIRRCFACCASDAGHVVTHKQAAPKYFCNADCYANIHSMVRFIK